jgi:DNA modification methylase
VVLNNTCGNGSTCVAAIRTGRRYIGIELDVSFAVVARQRCQAAEAEREENNDI